LRRFRALADCLASETAFIEIADTVIDEEFRAACDKRILKSPQSYGSAIGRLDGVNVHDRKFFRLYPEGQDRGVECFFAEQLYVKVLEAMRKRVQVQGLIQRDPDGVGIDQIRQVQEVRIIPESKDLPRSYIFRMLDGFRSSGRCHPVNSNDRHHRSDCWKGATPLAQQKLEGILLQTFVDTIDLTSAIAFHAADLRRSVAQAKPKLKLKTPDAIVIASAIRANADFIISTDKHVYRLNGFPGIKPVIGPPQTGLKQLGLI